MSDEETQNAQITDTEPQDETGQDAPQLVKSLEDLPGIKQYILTVALHDGSEYQFPVHSVPVSKVYPYTEEIYHKEKEKRYEVYQRPMTIPKTRDGKIDSQNPAVQVEYQKREDEIQDHIRPYSTRLLYHYFRLGYLEPNGIEIPGDAIDEKIEYLNEHMIGGSWQLIAERISDLSKVQEDDVFFSK